MEVPAADWSGVDERIQRLADVAANAGCTSLVVKKQSTISWLLGVRSNVPNTLDATCYDIVLDVLTKQLRVITNAIEAPRLKATELRDLAAELQIVPWWEDRESFLPTGADVGSDSGRRGCTDLSVDVARTRRRLDARQQQTLREVCRDAAAAATRSAMRITPEMTEYEAAGLYAQELLSAAMDPIVLMVAGDARMARDRHPIPTTHRLGRRGMLVCCARRHGLVASVTRIVAFEPLQPEERNIYESLLAVEAGFLDASRPGAVLGDVLQTGTRGYAIHGFDTDEWHHHHQGGYSGWDSREFPARPDSVDILEASQVVAWNQSGRGWKVEDTCLITDAGAEPLVTDGTWPTIEIGGRSRPAVLERI